MATIDLSELRERADDVAAILRRGETLTFTDHGRVVAVSHADAEGGPASVAGYEERYQKAVREGRILPATGAGDMKEILAIPKVDLGGKPLLDHVLESREEDYRDDGP